MIRNKSPEYHLSIDTFENVVRFFKSVLQAFKTRTSLMKDPV